MRRTPADMGLLPDGAATKAKEAVATTGYTLGQSVRLPIFWMLAVMILFLNALNMGIQQHLIPYLTDLGHSSTFAANIMAVYLGMTVAGKLVLGRLSDKEGVIRGYVVFCVVLGWGSESSSARRSPGSRSSSASYTALPTRSRRSCRR